MVRHSSARDKTDNRSKRIQMTGEMPAGRHGRDRCAPTQLGSWPGLSPTQLARPEVLKCARAPNLRERRAGYRAADECGGAQPDSECPEALRCGPGACLENRLHHNAALGV